MTDHTLVLNKNWVAIMVTTSFSALLSVCRDRAECMCTETFERFTIDRWIERSIERAEILPPEKFIKAVRFPIEKPEIIIIKDYGGVPFKQVHFTKRNVFKRDSYVCQYCGEAFTSTELTIDHVIPRSRGGANTWENCVSACERCNAYKGDRTPQECGFTLIKQPKMPRWTPISGTMPHVRPESWNRFLKT